MKTKSRRLYLQFRLVGWLLLLALTTGRWVSSANAQATTAQMLGKVIDQTGAVIPNATIEVQNTGTGLDRTTTSASTGEYVIPSLPVGLYRLKATATGFKTYYQSGIVLEDGQQARVDAILQIGDTSETVQVTAQAVQVDTSSGSIRTEVDSTQIRELPLNTRNTLQLTTLVPGVGNASNGGQTGSPTAGGVGSNPGAASTSLPVAVTNQRNGPILNVNGNRANGSEILLDGAIIVTSLYNRPANLPNPDSIGEFVFLTNSYSAEYGHASGAAFVAVSKSGSNRFHGSAWEFLRNDALNARNWFAPAPAAKPTLKQNQFGVAAGGPIIRNKAFFYATYEGLRIHQIAIQNFATLTAAERSGDFSALSTWLTDPSTGKHYGTQGTSTYNQIPKSEWDPLALGFMNYYMPTAGTNGLYYGQWASPITGDQFTGRFDFNVTKNDLAYVRFFRTNETSPTYSGTNVSYDNYSEPNQGYTIRETHTFTPSLIGDFGFSDTNITTNVGEQGAIAAPSAIGLTYAVDGQAISPQVALSGGPTTVSAAPWYENSALKQIDGKITWVKGRSTWQFGFLFLHEAEQLNAQLWTSGRDTFTGAFTGNAFADLLIGRPAAYLQRSTFNNLERSETFGMYGQDNYKVTSRLTLNLGLRYDLMVPWAENGGESAAPTLNSSFHSTLFPSAPPGYAVAGDPGIPRGFIFMDKADLEPRLGFAYDVFGDGKTAIRGGYGIFFNSPGAIMDSNLSAEPFVASLSFAPNSLSNPYGTQYTNPFPFKLNRSNPLWSWPTQTFSPDPNLKNAYVQQFNLNVQHEFPKDFMVQAGYVGSLGHRLWYGHEVNDAPYVEGETLQNAAALAQKYRPFENQYFAGIERASAIGYSNYNSLQLSARKRLSKGYTLQASYTFSKSLDTTSSADSDTNTNQDPNNLITGEYARSDFNQTHLFRFNWVWELSQFKNLGVAQYFIGGWVLSGIVNYSSGTPFSVTNGQSAPWLGAGQNLGNWRLNILHNACTKCGGRNQWTTHTPSGGYFDRTAFATPTIGTFGNSGRNSQVGPGYFDTDMSFVKNFPLLPRENSSVQFRADLFNLFNNVPLINPTTSNTSPVFGKITAAGNARQAQLALRLVF